MQIKTLKINNFRSYKEQEINLEDLGLVLIEGENRDAGGSNGAGKTTCVQAICWGLYGQTPEGVRGDSVVRHGKKDCYVGLTLEINGKTLLVDRFRKHSVHLNKLMVSYDYQDVTQGRNVDTQRILNNILQIDWKTFQSVVLFPQGGIGIAGLSGIDQRHVFDQILGLNKFSVAQEKVKEWLAKDEQREAEAKQRIRELDAAIQADANNLSQLKEKSETWENHRESRILEAKETLLRHEQSKPKTVVPLKEKEDGLLNKLQKLREDDVLTLYQESREALQTLMYRQKELQRQSFVKQVEFDPAQRLREQGECPACGQDLPRDAQEKLLRSFQEELSQLRERNKQIEQERLRNIREQNETADQIQAHTNRIEGAEKLAEVTDALQAEIQKVSREIQAAEWEVQDWNSRLQVLRQESARVESEGNPYEDLIQKSESYLKLSREEIERRQQALEPLQASMESLKFWRTAFSGRGVKQLLFSTVTPFLNERANLYMRELSNSTAQIKIKTQKLLKSGETRDDLNFEVSLPGTGASYEAKSGGERRRADIAIQFALADLAAARSRTPVQFLILDEIFDNLDVQGAEQVVDLLIQHVVPVRKTVLVITHNDALKTLFEQRIKVIKKNGVSRLEMG